MANKYSLDFELSSSQYASIADASQTGLDITGDVSLEAWIKLEQLPSTAGTEFYITGKWTQNSGKRSYALSLTTADKLRLYWSSANEENFVESNAAVVTAGDVGAWVHLAGTLDVSVPTGVLYKNASVVASTVTGTLTSIQNGTAPYAIGARNTDETPSGFFDGLIDDVRVWNDIRTGTEITNNYQTELVGNEAGLVAYHKLNNNYLDETSNNNDLTASGSPVFSTDIPFDRSSGFLVFM